MVAYWLQHECLSPKATALIEWEVRAKLCDKESPGGLQWVTKHVTGAFGVEKHLEWWKLQNHSWQDKTHARSPQQHNRSFLRHQVGHCLRILLQAEGRHHNLKLVASHLLTVPFLELLRGSSLPSLGYDILEMVSIYICGFSGVCGAWVCSLQEPPLFWNWHNPQKVSSPGLTIFNEDFSMTKDCWET